MSAVALIDSDVLSDLARGHPAVVRHAAEYLARHGCLTLSVVTVYERLRGYGLALKKGRPIENHLQQFESLVAKSVVLPVDVGVARVAAKIWTRLPGRQRHRENDILIAATAAAHGIDLVTHNSADFLPMRSPEVALTLRSWHR